MKIEAHAKLNFTLEVLGKREDGYHDLRSVVVPISLCDEIEIEAADTLSSNLDLADDLCLKAARALDATKCARITVEKHIPLGSGMGGGSADAAAVLKALNEFWGLNRAKAELLDIAATVGSDVPSLVMGGKVLMEGRGERVKPIASAPGSINLVLANPGCQCSTAEVYAASRKQTGGAASKSEQMMAALRGGNLFDIACSLSNDLTSAACVLQPRIGETMAAMRAIGIEGVSMSGSGSTVFGLVPDEPTARRRAEEMKSRGFEAIAVKSFC